MASGDVQIAYQAFGAGPDLVWIPGWVSQLDLYWEEPSLVRFLRRLASLLRVVVFDRRGIGLSDRVSIESLPTLVVVSPDGGEPGRGQAGVIPVYGDGRQLGRQRLAEGQRSAV